MRTYLYSRQAEVVVYGRIAEARPGITPGPAGVADRMPTTGSRPRTACLPAVIHRRSGRRAAAGSDDFRRNALFGLTKVRSILMNHKIDFSYKIKAHGEILPQAYD